MSGRRVIFKPMALDDVEETFIFLYDRSPQAASAFVDATHLTARVVAKRPGNREAVAPWRAGFA